MSSLSEHLTDLDYRIELWHLAHHTDDGEWLPIDELIAPDRINAAFDRLLDGCNGQRDVAGSFLSVGLSTVFVEACTESAIIDRRGWPLPYESTHVRISSEGTIDGLAITHDTLWVLADDPQASSDDVSVLESLGALHDNIAKSLVDTVSPLFTAVRSIAPFGLPGMWGGVVDDVASIALRAARRRNADATTAWNDAVALIDRIAARVPQIRGRPTMENVTWSGGVTPIAAKGTCCLFYKVADDRTSPGNYCYSCPLRPEDERRDRWAKWFADDANRTDIDAAPDGKSST